MGCACGNTTAESSSMSDAKSLLATMKHTECGSFDAFFDKF